MKCVRFLTLILMLISHKKCQSSAHVKIQNLPAQHPTRLLVAVEPRRPPVTDVGTETTFRLDQRKRFQKK